MKSTLLIITVSLFGLNACQSDTASFTHLEGKAQGTTFSIIYRDSFERDFSEAIDSLFRVIDHSMSLWDSTSVISRINRNEVGIEPDEHFIEVFRKSQLVSEKTKGAFDITVGPLVNAWGFRAKKNNISPDSATIDSILLITGYQKVKIENGFVIKEKAAMQLDFNAIAQGYTVDLVAAWMSMHGVQDYLVEIGGEVRAAGKNERKTTWQIGIDKPVEKTTEERPLQITIALENKALATSGSYRKYIQQGQRKLSHIINPVTGYPVPHQLISVSVLAADCTTADAYATAFMVMGKEEAFELAKILQLEVYFISVEEDGSLSTAASPGFPK